MTEGVYIIEHELGPLKIGRSTNPERRLKSLQTACPYELELLAFVETGDAARIEANLHERFEHANIRGEWFRLKPIDRGHLLSLLDDGRGAVRKRYCYTEGERYNLGKMEVALR